jgi:hypothetical protein
VAVDGLSAGIDDQPRAATLVIIAGAIKTGILACAAFAQHGDFMRIHQPLESRRFQPKFTSDQRAIDLDDTLEIQHDGTAVTQGIVALLQLQDRDAALHHGGMSGETAEEVVRAAVLDLADGKGDRGRLATAYQLAMRNDAGI